MPVCAVAICHMCFNQEYFQRGVEAYYDEDWLASVQYIEQSLPEYFKEYQKCLALCDYPYDQHAFSELHQQIINSNVANRDKLLLGNDCPAAAFLEIFALTVVIYNN